MAIQCYGQSRAIRKPRNGRFGWCETVRREGDTETVKRVLLMGRNTHIRSKYEKISVSAMMKSLARKRFATGSAVTDALHTSLHVLAKTWIDAKQRADELEALISDLMRDNAPALLEIDGCGARQRCGRQPRKAPLKSSTRLALRRLADRGVERQDRQAQAQPGR